MQKKITKLLMCIILLIPIFNLSSLSASANNSTNQRTHYLKLIFDNKVVYHDKVSEGKYIQVLNNENEILESTVLKSDLEIELAQPNIPESQILNYWDIQDVDTHFKIKPIFITSKEFQSTFTAESGGFIIHNNSTIRQIAKTYNENTLFKDIAPEIIPNENFKFKGWFITKDNQELKKLEITDNLKANHLENYQALFYQDVNDNNLDDTSEKILLKFVTKNGQTITDMNLHVGQPFSLPKLKIKDNHIFIGWYLDDEYKNKYNTNTPLTTDTTLYAKWEEVEKVIEDSQNSPITDQNIADQIESILNGRLDKLEEAVQRSGQSKNPSTNNTSSALPNNANNNILPQPETVTQSQNESNSNKVLTYTEPKYVFTNPSVGERYVIRFHDEHGYQFSVVLPYGRTMKLLDQNENTVKEYTVRQDTIITLNSNDYIFGENELLKFDSRTIKENSSDVTQVFPVLKPIVKKSDSSQVEGVSQENDSNKLGLIIFVALSIISIVLILLYLKRRYKKIEG